MASIGHHTAVADIFGLNFSGVFAWWLWRTVYLAKLPRIDRKIRVVLDWTLDLFFPRDINHLSPRFSSLLKEVYLEPGDVLFEAGEPAFSLYIVKSGRIEIRDREEVIRRVTAGEYFGERPLLRERIWQYEARAGEATVLASLPASVFHQIAPRGGTLGRFFEKSAGGYHWREVLETLSQRMPGHLAAKPVGDLMQRRLHTLRPSMTVREAVEIVRTHPRSSYPVLDPSDRLVGTVQREDFYDFIKRPETTPESRLEGMRFSALPTADRSRPVGEVMKDLIRQGVNKMLVVDSGQRVIGIITLVDIVAAQNLSSNGDPRLTGE